MLFLRYNCDCIYKWCYLKYNEPFFTINKVILNGKNPFQYNNRIMPFLQIIMLVLCLKCDCEVQGLYFECDYELNWWDVISYDTCLIISDQYKQCIMPFLKIIMLFSCLECDCEIKGLYFECDYKLNWWDVISDDTCLIISKYILGISYFNLTQLCTT